MKNKELMEKLEKRISGLEHDMTMLKYPQGRIRRRTMPFAGFSLLEYSYGDWSATIDLSGIKKFRMEDDILEVVYLKDTIATINNVYTKVEKEETKYFCIGGGVLTEIGKGKVSVNSEFVEVEC